VEPKCPQERDFFDGKEQPKETQINLARQQMTVWKEWKELFGDKWDGEGTAEHFRIIAGIGLPKLIRAVEVLAKSDSKLKIGH
jgi:hypothetical protein